MFVKVIAVVAFLAYTQAGELGQATSYSSITKHAKSVGKVALAPVAHYAPVAHIAHVAPVAHYTHVAPVAHVAHVAHVAPVAHIAHVAPVAHIAHVAPVAHYAPVASHASSYSSVSNHIAHAAPVAHFAPIAHVAHVAPVIKTVQKEVYADAHPHYSFEYGVKDTHTHDIKDQQEERDGDVVKGHYSLLQPDGVTRTVHYTADDHNGFNANVEYKGHAAHPEVQQKVLLAH